jgi:glycosyltransferase involved in cell wall biosynthesis
MTSRLRVCIVAESYYPVIGGMERQAHALAKGFAAIGFEAFIVALRANPSLLRNEVLDGIEVRRVSSSGNRWRGIIGVARELTSLRTRYDVVLVQGFRTLGLAAVLAGWIFHKPVVLAAQNNGELSGEFFDPALRSIGLRHDSWFIRPLNGLRKAVLRRANAFAALSNAMRDELLGEGVPQDRVVTIPNTVALDRFRPARDAAEKQRLREALGLPADGFVVCFCGRLVRWKGPLVVLEAWRRLSSEGVLSADALLIFLGAGGSDSDNCEAEAHAKAADAGLLGSVRFLGDVPNVEEYLRAADAFTLPTADDSFAIAVLEAMATGLAVITTTVSGLADYVIAGRNALVVKPDDPAGVATALAEVARSTAVRKALGEQAIATAAQFTPDTAVQRLVALFATLNA